jgi:hypothetical protein
MDSKWFCKIDEQEFGPLLIAQLQRLAKRGQLKANSYIRRGDSDVWMPAADLPELQSNFGGKKPSLPQARHQPVASSIPVAAVSPTVPPPPVAPAASEPGIQIATRPKATSAAGASPVEASTQSAGMNRAMLGGLIGLGCVIVILLVVVIFLIAGNGKTTEEQAADNQSTENGDAGETKQADKRAPVTKASATSATPNQSKKPPAVTSWAKASSKLGIRSKTTRLPVCKVGIKSVWLSDDPKGEVSGTRTITAAPSPKPNEKQTSDDDVLDLAALGVSKKKRVDITGKIIEPELEPRAVPAPEENDRPAVDPATDMNSFRYVFVQVSLSNTSPEEPLDYLGWNGDGESAQSKDAQLFDETDNECLFVSRIESPRDDRHKETTLAPGEVMLDVLVFELPESGFETLRLVLPNETIGLTDKRNMGYEIKKSDIVGGPLANSSVTSTVPKGVPPSSPRTPTKSDIDRGIQDLRDDLTKPEAASDAKAAVEQPAGKDSTEKIRDAKEEFQELKRLIEAEKERE